MIRLHPVRRSCTTHSIRRTQWIPSILFIWILLSILLLVAQSVHAQRPLDWQQEVEYIMEVELDAETHRMSGLQEMTFYNHSPDTLDRLFVHLYLNAFQPDSRMDVRSRTILDPDARVRDRIHHLNENEIGFQRVLSLELDGEPLRWSVDETVMEIPLADPLLPGRAARLQMEWEGQVPLQIRRTGRDNAEGIDYSMAQWYPKFANYDRYGWHADPYIGREFYAPFGTFDLTIIMDAAYYVAAIGEQQGEPEPVEGGKLRWRFLSERVHDVMWAADPDYRETILEMRTGPILRFYYQTDPVAENASDSEQEELRRRWEALPAYTASAFEWMSNVVGPYPYSEYKVIQGADGGMEYGPGTLITGNRSLESLVGVTVHELIHAWFQGILATNESREAWIDEGTTSYLSSRIMEELFEEETADRMQNHYRNYFAIVDADLEEPMNRHSDRFDRNVAYGIATYSKGAIFFHQLSHIVGQDALDRGLNRFYLDHAYTHPDGLDLLRAMERESGMLLGWYYNDWVESVRTIDYAIGEVTEMEEVTRVQLLNQGEMLMPAELRVRLVGGEEHTFYVPLALMRGSKPALEEQALWHELDPWRWVDPLYEVEIPFSLDEIQSMELNPGGRVADVDLSNNRWEPTR